MFFSLSVKYVYGKPTGCRSFSTKGKQPIKSVQERSNISSNSSGAATRGFGGAYSGSDVHGRLQQ